MEVQIEGPDGQMRTRYVFARFVGHVKKNDEFVLRYLPGREVMSKVIEVNKPLHYGGYHFYQSDYDHKFGRYTILSIASDSGLYVVYVGFALLGIGIFVHFWSGLLFRKIKSASEELQTQG